VLHGATEIGAFLSTDLRALVAAKTQVMRDWIKVGKMAAIDPQHLFFAIWATTQTYADFAAQIAAVTGSQALSDRDYAHATDAVVAMFLRAAGLAQ